MKVVPALNPPMDELILHSSANPDDFNLQDEYGGLLDLLEKYISEVDSTVEHYGVKGMHWGVRKSEPKSTRSPVKSLGPDSVSRKTASGETITLQKVSPTKLQNFMGRHSKSFREEFGKQAYLHILDGSGKRIGEASIQKRNNEELYLEWLGINKSSRGKGYASAVMKAGRDFGREEGFKRLILDTVDSPDARHIYEKMGFKYTGEANTMVYEFDAEHASLSPDSLSHYGVKGMHWGVHNDGPSSVSRKTNREARGDAKEFARAKMFYGEGAGTRRKLIKAAVESKSHKDPAYKRAFDHHLARQDMSKHAEAARGERKRKNIKKSAGRGIRGTRHILNGNSKYASAATAIAVGGALYAHKAGIDKIVLQKGTQAFKKIRDPEGMKRAQNLLRDMGIG